MKTHPQHNTAPAHTALQIIRYVGDKRVTLAERNEDPYSIHPGEIIASEVHPDYAALFAAAPELLAALKTALDWTEGDLDCPEVLDKQTIVERIKFIKSAIARAAIKAAKGVQS
jgi:hypothetical protein